MEVSVISKVNLFVLKWHVQNARRSVPKNRPRKVPDSKGDCESWEELAAENEHIIRTRSCALTLGFWREVYRTRHPHF